MTNNRLKLPINVIFYLFWFSVHENYSTVKLLNGCCWEYLDAFKIILFVKIEALQSFCELVNFEILQKINQYPQHDGIDIKLLVQVPVLKEA